MSPFVGQSLQLPPLPQGDDEAAWEAYREALAEQILGAPDSIRLGRTSAPMGDPIRFRKTYRGKI